MTAEQLKQTGSIYFENIEEGLRGYRNEIVKMKSGEAENVFFYLCEERGWEDSYTDFYYFTLEREIQRQLDELLTEDEKEYLKSRCLETEIINTGTKEVFFPLDKTLLPIVLKFNETEALFSTLYFAGAKGSRSSWWGNYNQEYIVFKD